MTSQTLLIQNALIVTCDPDHNVHANASLIVKDGRFFWIGPSEQTPQIAAAKTIDADGAILMPGLINMHAHCGDTLFRGLVEDLPLEDWLQTVWKAEAAILANPQQCQLGTELGIAELIQGGVTSIMDMFWHTGTGYAAAAKAGVRWASGEIFFDGTGMDGFAPETRAARAAAMFNQGHEFVGTLPHSIYTVSPESMRDAIELARENGGFFCTHAAETEFEQATARDRYQTSVIRHLDQLGALGPRTVLAHCVRVDDVEIKLMADSGTHIALNPMSNLKLASGFAPVPAFLKAGINLTLGTDGPISGNDMDMFLAMRLTATLHKATSKDAAAVTTKQVLHMATLNGARALGAEARLGSVECGKEADFILINTNAPHATPLFNPINHLVYAANKSDVRDVFVGGQHIMKDRQIPGLDLPDLCRRVRALQPEIQASLDSE